MNNCNKGDNKNLDDEETIEEEENKSQSSNENTKEIERLKKESEMPIEKLLLMYKNRAENPKDCYDRTINDVDEDEYEDDDDDENDDGYTDDDDEDSDEDYEENTSHENNIKDNIKLFSLIKDDHFLSGDEEDTDFDPCVLNDKQIKIGDDYQAIIPMYKSNYIEEASIIYEFDELIWNPFVLKERDVLNYIKQTDFVKKEDAKLILLHKCNYKIEEAIQKSIKMEFINNDIVILNEDENKNFEEGLKDYGKNFNEIHEKKLKTLKTCELINYYYNWKKSARYDVFLKRNNIKKKAQFSNTFMCDYMEHLILEREEQLKKAFTNIFTV